SAANRRAILWSPRKADGRTKVVPVRFVDSLAGIWRMRPDELERSQLRARSRLHPAAEVPAGNAEQRAASANQRCRQPAGFPRHAVVFPAKAQVESQGLCSFPIVFEEVGHFVLMEIANHVRRVAVVFPAVQ